MSVDPTQHERRAARAGWPVRVTDLNAEDLPAWPTPAAAFIAVWAVTLDAWASTGKPLPDYDRAHTPVARRRLDDPASA